MAIHISVQYSGGLLPDIILLTQGYYQWGTCSGFAFIAFVRYQGILLLPCVMVYYIVSGLSLMFFWCPCMAINNNANAQYNGGLLPDIILLTQCYLHRGTCLNAMKRF